jgi:ATP-dependent helicase/nuclease subunit A
MKFTAEQLAAIDISRLGQNASVVAGPGSGKTAVLVERYRQLVESGIEPANILAITFTEKAAANMRLRMSKEFAGDAEMLRKLERGWVSTIHSFCQRLLKQHSTAAGVDPAFQILDEQQAVLEQAAALRLTLDQLLDEQPAAMSALLEATASPDFEKLMPPIYDAMRAAGMTPDELAAMPDGAPPDIEEQILLLAQRYERGFPTTKTTPAQLKARGLVVEFLHQFVYTGTPAGRLRALLDFCPNKNTKNSESEVLKEIDRLTERSLDRFFAGERALLIEIFRRFDARYRDRKTALGTLDFNDLEFFTVRLLDSNPAIREQIREQFEQVMIDEFQDTSGLQSRLVKLVSAPGRFYAVGDLNQSIYSFRHARPDVFKMHRASVQQAGEHACELVENWRSRQAILDATQFLLKDVEGIERRDLKGARVFPARDHAHIEALEFLPAAADDDYKLEAQGVVTRIRELLSVLQISETDRTQRPARLNDFAILVRNTGVLKDFLDAFTEAGIPFNLNRRTGFLETREARDCTHLLRVINNPHDEISTLSLLRSPFAGASDEAVFALKLTRRNLGDALAYRDFSTLSIEDRTRLERFSAALIDWRAAAPFHTPDRLVLRALDQMGVAWDPSTSGGQNIEKFLSMARAQSDMTLPAFIRYLEAMRKENPREQDSPVDEELKAVQIMTTHAAKGLEFPVVILAAMNNGTASDASSGALNFTPEFGLGVKWCFENAGAKAGYIHAQNDAKLKATDEEESNRLLYVAMTRAEEHLILSWSRERDSSKPRNWAKLIWARFEMDSVLPNGQPEIRGFENFDVRLVRTAELPAATTAMAAASLGSPPVILERARLTEQFDPNTTATALSQFASCPRKYYLGHYLGWNGDLVRQRVNGTGLGAADIGTAVHHLLAGHKAPEAPFEALSLAQTFERSALGKRARKATRGEREWEFTFAVDPLVVRGSIDLWFEDAHGLTIVDYKTDDVSALDAKARAREYHVQIQLYALALERATGKRVASAWLSFLRPDVSVNIPLADGAQNIGALTERFAAAQENLDFPMIPTLACRRCEFYHTLCPAKLTMDAHA